MLAWTIALAVIIAVMVGFYIYVKWDSVCGFVVTGGSVIALMIFGYALSWIITCGVIKLIAMCFGWTFKWSVATGIWLIACLIKWLFSWRGKK